MISHAIQKGSGVYVYNEKNEMIFCKIGELYGYTSSSVSIKKAFCIYVYNDKGALKSTHMT